MSLALFLGYFAGFLTTVSFVPQVIKTWKTKSADDFSLMMPFNLGGRDRLLGCLWVSTECYSNYFMEFS